MPQIVPTVTAYTPDEYQEQIATVSTCGAPRVHIDLTDDLFASPQTVSLRNVVVPDTLEVDIHLMYQDVVQVLPELVALMPHLVVLHSESSGDVVSMMKHLKEHNIAVGLAFLQGSSVEPSAELLKLCDHALIFSGSLGSFGGTVDKSLLKKVTALKNINPHLEIGWDGGVNADNVRSLVAGGIDVLNVGGAIHNAVKPVNAYRELTRLVTS